MQTGINVQYDGTGYTLEGGWGGNGLLAFKSEMSSSNVGEIAKSIFFNCKATTTTTTNKYVNFLLFNKSHFPNIFHVHKSQRSMNRNRIKIVLRIQIVGNMWKLQYKTESLQFYYIFFPKGVH